MLSWPWVRWRNSPFGGRLTGPMLFVERHGPLSSACRVFNSACRVVDSGPGANRLQHDSYLMKQNLPYSISVQSSYLPLTNRSVRPHQRVRNPFLPGDQWVIDPAEACPRPIDNPFSSGDHSVIDLAEVCRETYRPPRITVTNVHLPRRKDGSFYPGDR